MGLAWLQDKSNQPQTGKVSETKDRRIPAKTEQDGKTERKTARPTEPPRRTKDERRQTEDSPKPPRPNPEGNAMTRTRKTKKMLAVEERFHQPLEKILPQMVTEQGLSATADELDVSKATLGYWLLKLGINVRRVALAPGETIEIKRVTQG